jgi:hypothetical protein
MVCKKFHASYLVEDSKLGKAYLCLSCWKARSSASGSELGQPDEKTGANPNVLDADLKAPRAPAAEV